MEPTDAASTFVVRIWPQHETVSRTTWRGSIDDVRRHRRLFFTSLVAMCEFIVEQRRLGVPTLDETGDLSD